MTSILKGGDASDILRLATEEDNALKLQENMLNKKAENDWNKNN